MEESQHYAEQSETMKESECLVSSLRHRLTNLEACSSSQLQECSANKLPYRGRLFELGFFILKAETSLTETDNEMRCLAGGYKRPLSAEMPSWVFEKKFKNTFY